MDIPVEGGESLENAGPLVAPIASDVAQELQKPTVVARRIGWRARVTAENAPPQNARERKGCRRVDENDGVGARESDVHRPAVVSVRDPPVGMSGVEKLDLLSPPFVAWRVDPPRAPEVAVEVDHGQTRELPQSFREPRLAGAADPDDRDPPRAGT